MRTIAIAGASGFVGRALIERLQGKYRLIALGRNPPAQARRAGESGLEWRSCDLYSLRDAEDVLAGCDAAVYLVHSMSPSARLTQARFEDADLILADNFARAAERNGLKQIVYVGGILPSQSELSRHLASRLEVERALGSGAAPLTALRAGLVIGAGGSSFQILQRLVERLPIMICPAWMRSLTQPVALEDLLIALESALLKREFYGRTLDISGPDVLSYAELIRRTARALGLRRWLVPVPFFSPQLSVLWVRLFSGANRELIAPLVESLKHDMLAKPDPLVRKMKLANISTDDALRAAVAGTAQPGPARQAQRQRQYDSSRTVRSVQRLPLPAGRDARWVARRYPLWLKRFLRPFLKVDINRSGRTRIGLRFMERALLELNFAESRSAADRQLFYISGGLLARSAGRDRLEFRETPDGASILAAIHDFEPALPWPIYNLTQARAHLFVMHSFARYLGRRDRSRRRRGSGGALRREPGSPFVTA